MPVMPYTFPICKFELSASDGLARGICVQTRSKPECKRYYRGSRYPPQQLVPCHGHIKVRRKSGGRHRPPSLLISPMFSPTVFPNEIYDYIIDHLHKDRRTLLTCSLVCKDWRTTSRFHLFSVVELHVQDVDRDLEILSSPLATISACVQHLSIDACTDVEPESGLFEKLVRGLPPMKQLKVLRLHEVNFQLSSSAKGNLFSISRDIATLELTNVNVSTPPRSCRSESLTSAN